ncbi:MAG: hypothetical protein A2104_04525 [Candidatus Melainabacteria bacterium GWF2_32_7]|nr:MAG: hypothetical protein A2104_04525 [Candidatus Melainabacteria bacterium GWF2_32_7]
MKRALILIIISLIGVNFSTPTYAQNLTPATYTEQNQETKQINTLIEKFLKCSNSHDFDEIKKFYAPNYISGDGLKKVGRIILIFNIRQKLKALESIITWLQLKVMIKPHLKQLKNPQLLMIQEY